jgi:D-alanyl-D-alanine carboxypeptidase/D-alanyl-D-alanine-endopeptidase (penicillin-binding protein 4)
VTPASLEQLAKLTAKALLKEGNRKVRLSYDTSLFSGPAISPDWEPSYVPSGVIAPVSALMADEGRTSVHSVARAVDPARLATQTFATLLGKDGIRVVGSTDKTRPKNTDQVISTVSSPTIADIVERMLTDSDDQVAESLGRLSAIAAGRPGSFSGASRTLVHTAKGLAPRAHRVRLFDASGLARGDRLPAAVLVAAVVAAASPSDTSQRSVLSGLAVAGFTGTLTDRYLLPPSSSAAGIVRAKTGTLSGVSAEAGLTTTKDGHLLAFAFLADKVPYVDTLDARASLDDAAAGLYACGCG